MTKRGSQNISGGVCKNDLDIPEVSILKKKDILYMGVHTISGMAIDLINILLLLLQKCTITLKDIGIPMAILGQSISL